MKLFTLKISMISIWLLVSPGYAAKPPAQTEEELFQELADQYLREEMAAGERKKMKYEQERSERIRQERDKGREAAAKKAQAQAQDEELKRARAELEESIAAQRQEKELEAQLSQKYFDQLFERGLHDYQNEKPFMVEYLSTATLKALLAYVKGKNDTSIIAPLAHHYNMGINAMSEFIVKFEAASANELQKRAKSTGMDFKSLIIKGLGNPPYTVHFETFQILEDKLQAIDLLLHNKQELERWALEQNSSAEQIIKALNNIRQPLLAMKVDVKEHVFRDFQKAEKEQAEEQAARDHALKVVRETKKLQEYHLKREDVKKEYPQFFHGIPNDLEVDFLKKFEELFGNGKNINQVLTTLYFGQEHKAREQRLIALGLLLDLVTYSTPHGYVYFDNNKRTHMSNMTLPQMVYRTSSDKERIAAAQELVKTYKIHLMPAQNIDVAEILVRIKKALTQDSQLSSLIQTFKILYSPTQQNGTTFARLVIYANGKEQAQKIVDALYHNKIMSEMPGSGLRPRFNGKVNDLIWIAQGDGDFKMENLYDWYYEMPAKIYYRKDITGKVENYHLINPGTKQEVVN